MKTLKQPRFLPLCLLASSIGWICAPAFSQDEGDEEVFWLSPFEVTTEGSSGYERVSAGTATRISMDIIDTPLAIAVISEEFIKDTGRTELVDIFDYASSVDTSPDDALRNSDIKVRGFGVSFVLRDGFKKYYDAPLDAVDRVEVVKGPNAVFFGQAQPGGVINYITKSPLWDPYYEARMEIGDNNVFKAWADATGPVTDWMAYRLITSYRDSESWKSNTSWENKYVFSSVTVRPLKKMEINGKYEYHTGYQEGGINTALVGNQDYYDDYYANGGQDYGYAVDWTKASIAANTVGISSVGVRYPWPTPLTAAEIKRGYVEPPATGWGGINPRWDGTISQQLSDFFGGNVPAAYLNWSQPDQGNFPAYQRNVALPFQYQPIEYYSAGNGASYKPGWRVMKWFESNQQEYPNRFTGPIFPKGYNWNSNGKSSYHDTEHHIATVELKAEIFKWLNFRYAGNYLENTYLRVQQHNSDPDMDGSTLSPAQGYLTPTSINEDGILSWASISGASANMFENKRYTHQADLTADFEIGGTKHTILLSGEYREDRFIEYALTPSDYYAANALRISQYNTRVEGLPASWTYQEGVGNWDVFYDETPDIAKWADIVDPAPGASSSYHEQESVSVSWRGTFFKERLSVLAGVRWEETTNFVYAIPKDENGQPVGTKPRVGAVTGDPLSETTPMVGLNYTIKDGLALYASYSESFVPPSRTGATSVTYYEGPIEDGVNDGTPVTVPVSPLGPERGVGYEAGIKASGFDGKVSGSMTVFHLERQDIIVLDSAWVEQLRANYLEYGRPWNNSIDSGNSSLRKNSGVEVSEGLEMDVIYRHTPNLSFTASLTYLWKAELENPDAVDFYGDINAAIGSNTGPYPHPSLFTDTVLGTYTIPSTGQVVEILQPLSTAQLSSAISDAAANGTEPVNPVTGETLVFEPIQHRELAQVSDLRFSLWTLYEFTEGRLDGLTIGGGGNYQSKQRPQQDRDLDYWNPGFWIFDVMARYDIPFGDGNLFSIQLNVNNIFDTREIDSGSFGINAPRTWKLTGTVKF